MNKFTKHRLVCFFIAVTALVVVSVPTVFAKALPKVVSQIKDQKEGKTRIDIKAVSITKNGANLDVALESYAPIKESYLAKISLNRGYIEDRGLIDFTFDVDNKPVTVFDNGSDFKVKIVNEAGKFKGSTYNLHGNSSTSIYDFTPVHKAGSVVLRFSIPIKRLGSPKTFSWKMLVDEAVGSPGPSGQISIITHKTDLAPNKGWIKFPGK
jgi:hypothetical protein